MASDMTLGEAAAALGVSVDTLRRWDRAGRLRTKRDGRNRRMVPVSEIKRLSGRPDRHQTGTHGSARNRFPGVVRSVESDGVMALVEIEAGRFCSPPRIRAVWFDSWDLPPAAGQRPASRQPHI